MLPLKVWKSLEENKDVACGYTFVFSLEDLSKRNSPLNQPALRERERSNCLKNPFWLLPVYRARDRKEGTVIVLYNTRVHTWSMMLHHQLLQLTKVLLAATGHLQQKIKNWIASSLRENTKVRETCYSYSKSNLNPSQIKIGLKHTVFSYLLSK